MSNKAELLKILKKIDKYKERNMFLSEAFEELKKGGVHTIKTCFGESEIDDFIIKHKELLSNKAALNWDSQSIYIHDSKSIRGIIWESGNIII